MKEKFTSLDDIKYTTTDNQSLNEGFFTSLGNGIKYLFGGGKFVQQLTTTSPRRTRRFIDACIMTTIYGRNVGFLKSIGFMSILGMNHKVTEAYVRNVTTFIDGLAYINQKGGFTKSYDKTFGGSFLGTLYFMDAEFRLDTNILAMTLFGITVYDQEDALDNLPDAENSLFKIIRTGDGLDKIIVNTQNEYVDEQNKTIGKALVDRARSIIIQYLYKYTTKSLARDWGSILAALNIGQSPKDMKKLHYLRDYDDAFSNRGFMSDTRMMSRSAKDGEYDNEFTRRLRMILEEIESVTKKQVINALDDVRKRSSEESVSDSKKQELYALERYYAHKSQLFQTAVESCIFAFYRSSEIHRGLQFIDKYVPLLIDMLRNSRVHVIPMSELGDFVNVETFDNEAKVPQTQTTKASQYIRTGGTGSRIPLHDIDEQISSGEPKNYTGLYPDEVKPFVQRVNPSDKDRRMALTKEIDDLVYYLNSAIQDTKGDAEQQDPSNKYVIQSIQKIADSVVDVKNIYQLIAIASIDTGKAKEYNIDVSLLKSYLGNEEDYNNRLKSQWSDMTIDQLNRVLASMNGFYNYMDKLSLEFYSADKKQKESDIKQAQTFIQDKRKTFVDNIVKICKGIYSRFQENDKSELFGEYMNIMGFIKPDTPNSATAEQKFDDYATSERLKSSVLWRYVRMEDDDTMVPNIIRDKLKGEPLLTRFGRLFASENSVEILQEKSIFFNGEENTQIPIDELMSMNAECIEAEMELGDKFRVFVEHRKGKDKVREISDKLNIKSREFDEYKGVESGKLIEEYSAYIKKVGEIEKRIMEATKSDRDFFQKRGWESISLVSVRNMLKRASNRNIIPEYASVVEPTSEDPKIRAKKILEQYYSDENHPQRNIKIDTDKFIQFNERLDKFMDKIENIIKLKDDDEFEE